jgi:hypothetical protein
VWWIRGMNFWTLGCFAETFKTVALALGPGTENTCIPARCVLAGGRAAARRPVYGRAGSDLRTPQ